MLPRCSNTLEELFLTTALCKHITQALAAVGVTGGARNGYSSSQQWKMTQAWVHRECPLLLAGRSIAAPWWLTRHCSVLEGMQTMLMLLLRAAYICSMSTGAHGFRASAVEPKQRIITSQNSDQS